MHVLTVIGNRPQFIKAAAVSHRLREAGREVLVHTGQHYDDELSRIFFDELSLPRPEQHLGIGGGSNTSQTARMLEASEAFLASTTREVQSVAAIEDREFAEPGSRTNEAAEAICTMEDLDRAEEAFIASSVREVMPIAVIDDIELPAAPGPVTQAAAQALAQRIERELAGAGRAAA